MRAITTLARPSRFQHSVLLIVLLISMGSCGSQHLALYNREKACLNRQVKATFAQHIDQFNAYTGRPKPDGPFNAGNNKKFLLSNVPLFSCSDTAISRVYDYRWWMISKHLKQYHDPYDDKNYWVITEFFGPRPWASLSGAITCPAGQQFYDVRWLRNDKFLQSYAEYFMRGSASKLNQRENSNFLTYLSRPESHHFSSWMIDGISAFLKVHPNRKWMTDMLPDMERHQHIWDSLFTVKLVGAKTNGMYKILDLYDGMEFSLSAVMGLIHSVGAYSLYTPDTWRKYYLGWETTGNADTSSQAKAYPKAFRKGYPDFYLVRPSVNSYAYGNLNALANMYRLKTADTASQKKANNYAQQANEVREKTLQLLWNQDDQFFNTYSAGDNQYGTRDYEARVRESVGYTPWYFRMIPTSDFKTYAGSWEMFASRRGFYNTAGMTTAEQQHPYYNEKAYAWNGRGWPFENSVVYKGFANYLRDYKKNASNSDKKLLYDYIEKLARMHGTNQLNIGEWYIPSDGKIFGGESDYFHSTFPDIIIEDLLGFKAMHTNQFSISPLLPDNQWDHFYLGNLRYHGHDIDILWKKDWEPRKQGDQERLCVWIDGKLSATSPSLNQELTVNLPQSYSAPANNVKADN